LRNVSTVNVRAVAQITFIKYLENTCRLQIILYFLLLLSVCFHFTVNADVFIDGAAEMALGDNASILIGQQMFALNQVYLFNYPRHKTGSNIVNFCKGENINNWQW